MGAGDDFSYFVPPRARPEWAYLFKGTTQQMLGNYAPRMAPAFGKYRLAVADPSQPTGKRPLTESEMADFERDHPELCPWLKEDSAESAGGWRAECKELLNDLLKRKESFFFRNPVDQAEVDYHSVVKCPMSLNEVKELFEAGKISDPEDFVDHVRLVFRNCWYYNPPELTGPNGVKQKNSVYYSGRTISKHFEEKLAKLRGDNIFG